MFKTANLVHNYNTSAVSIGSLHYSKVNTFDYTNWPENIARTFHSGSNRNMIKRGNSCKNAGTITTSRKGVTFWRPIKNGGGGGSNPVRNYVI